MDPSLISLKSILSKYGESLYLPLVELRKLPSHNFRVTDCMQAWRGAPENF